MRIYSATFDDGHKVITGHSHQSDNCPNAKKVVEVPTTTCSCHPSPTSPDLLASIAEMVGGLGDEIYPRDVFPALSKTDYENIKEVERQFPNLVSRIDTAACHRAFTIARAQIEIIIAEREGK